MAILYAALAAFLFGTADFTGGFASRKNAIPAVLVWSQIAGLLLVGLFLLVDRTATLPSAADAAYGAAAGVAGLGGLALLYRGLSRGYVAIVSPLAAVLGAVVPLVAGLAFGERLSIPAAVGIAVSLPAIVLVSWHGHLPESARNPRRIAESGRDGVLSGVFFGLFFVFISRTDPGSGMWPLAVARVASIVLMFAGAVSTRREFRITATGRSGPVTVAAAGLLDMAANIFLLLAIRQGLLVIVTVIASAYPAQTVLLSRIFFGERIGPVRLAGIVLALVGIALMSV
ncbi:MAG: EamA family transporter [Spirochaeta sp.]|jgi:drug/metabolite transporter (DMT)-like permease|nr:EamA family transporter [Spirochaeta sp.]